MTRKGWIKIHRAEQVGLLELTDQQCRYYLAARMTAVWDKKNKLFGTFDCRTEVVKADMLPNWATGKINEVKRELLARRYFIKTDDHRRLRITNIEVLHTKGKNYDNLIQENEHIIHSVEINIHAAEKTAQGIRNAVHKIAGKMSMDSQKYSPG